jgi:hypothetical protein
MCACMYRGDTSRVRCFACVRVSVFILPPPGTLGGGGEVFGNRIVARMNEAGDCKEPVAAAVDVGRAEEEPAGTHKEREKRQRDKKKGIMKEGKQSRSAACSKYQKCNALFCDFTFLPVSREHTGAPAAKIPYIHT